VTYSKKKYLWRLLVALPLAAGVYLAAGPGGSGAVVGVLVLLVAAGYAVLYLTSSLTFNPDGSISQGRARMLPHELTGCYYFRVFTGGGRWPSLGVFCLYSQPIDERAAATPALLSSPEIMVWSLGWTPADRAALFRDLREWLSRASLRPDPRAAQRLAEL
jgi:hypothetical protein